MKFTFRAALTLLAALSPLRLAADEGIWLFNQFPKDKVLAEHGFRVDDAFLNRLRKASVRFNNGGSGSLVSPTGLLFTNHHVGSDCIQKLSSAEHNYMDNGFYAPNPGDERACPDLEVNILAEIEDVAAAVNRDVTSAMDTAESNRVRKASMTRIEKACNESSGLRCDVVTLYSGGLYHLYKYKKYTDVRLVFAPEVGIAAFGGDPDNFTYPRYCLDFAFFRAYENGKPAATPDFLAWSKTGVRDGELTFVSGHPGSTGRLATLAELEFSRDLSYSFIFKRLESLIAALQKYSEEGEEHRRIGRDNLFTQQNSYKAYTGFLRGLRDASLINRKRDEEQTMKAAVMADAKMKRDYGEAWDRIAAAFAEYREFYVAHWLLERGAGRGSELFRIARDVTRYAEEKAKPNEQRLREYVDPALPSLEQEMFSAAPVHPSMEIAVLAEYFAFMRQELGEGDETVRALLGGRTPEQAAKDCVNGTKLADVAERKRLAGDATAAASSTDAMMRLMRIIDPRARQLRKRYEDKVEAVLQADASRIALARFAVRGKDDYPDATFTLRLSYGPVKGYRNAAGKPVPYATNFAGLYQRATGKDPFRLPERWVKAKGALKLKTPFNFVSTNDTHGGNSGSPTVNTKGEVIGILFDGNIEGLPNRFVFTDEQARSVHVASQGIIEALRSVYKTGRILGELGFPAK